MPAADPQEAELRQLTVMFCDLVGSMGLSKILDPEDLREVVRSYQQVCSEVIQRLDGYVAQYLGDGLLVYFGFPRAHEDSAERAVQAGLEIFAALEKLNAQEPGSRGFPLAVRIGVHTGPVVIGNMGGAGRSERLALGETPNLAARIQGLAEPGALLISDRTFQLIPDRFQCQDLGPRSVRGIEVPIRVFRVLHGAGIPGRPFARTVARLVGREAEREVLAQAWESARRGNGGTVLLRGEAGIGKSRLVEDLLQRISSAEIRILRIQGSSLYQQSALHPLIEPLWHALDPARSDRPEAAIAKLVREPLLNPQKQQEALCESIAEWLVQSAGKRPMLLVWEDVQWMDPSTLDVLARAVARVPGRPVLLLLTSRPEFEAPWTGRPEVIHLAVQRLNGEQAELLVRDAAGGRELPPEVMRQLIARGDGVPLYLEELTRTVLESDLLRPAGDRFVLAGPLPALAVPESLQDSLLARLDRLGAVRGVVQAAAVLGRSFPYGTICAMSPVNGRQLDRELARLVEAEILVQEGSTPEARYTFRHALLQETAYESILRSRRQQLHRRAAEALENEAAAGLPAHSAGRLALLAHHWSRSLDPRRSDPDLVRKTLGLLRNAGEQALRLSAYAEALDWFGQALRLLGRVPESRERHEEELALRARIRSASSSPS